LYYSEFSEIGHEVLTVPSAFFDFLEKLEGFDPDVIVLDIRAGDREGLQMFHRVRAFFPEPPVVLCSAYAISRWETGPLSPDCCVVKSFDLTGLQAKVEQALAARTPLLSAV
jgi:DNA-binding response OmpR family regulator